MTLKEKLTEDFKDAMKAKDNVKKNTVNLVRAAIKQYEVDNRKELDDAGVLDILSKQVKMRKDALADFQKAGRTDLIESYTDEINVLLSYLPEMMSLDDIKNKVEETATELGIEKNKQNMGKLMGAIMPKVKGMADGDEVRKAVMDFLGE